VTVDRNTKLSDPSVEVLRDCIKDGYCWWCDSSPWKMLAGHTSKAHGITATDLRRLAYLYKDTSICSPEHSYACTQRPQTLHPSPKLVRKAGGTCALSERARKEHTERLMAMATPEQRQRAGQKAAEKTRKPHHCPGCGTLLPTAHPITCSSKCRKIVRQRTALVSAATRKRLSEENPEYGMRLRRKLSEVFKKLYAEEKLRVPRKPHPCPVCGTLIPKAHPIACSPGCLHVLLQRAQAKAIQHRAVKVPREDYPKIAERCWSSESTTVIAADYGVTPRFIRAIAKEEARIRVEAVD